MPPNDSLYPADWTADAEKDLNRLARASGDNDPELAGFCLQHAVEKFLKAFLLSNGWELRRIYTFAVLLDNAIRVRTNVRGVLLGVPTDHVILHAGSLSNNGEGWYHRTGDTRLAP